MSGQQLRAHAEATLFTRSDVVQNLLSLQLGQAKKRFAESRSLRD